jgi:hypothetical protein
MRIRTGIVPGKVEENMSSMSSNNLSGISAVMLFYLTRGVWVGVCYMPFHRAQLPLTGPRSGSARIKNITYALCRINHRCGA